MNPVTIHPDPAAAGAAIAADIADLIRRRQAEGRPTVLGLATGATPVPVYRELVRLHQEEGLGFEGVRSFNLDEYWPIDPAHPRSFARFMREELFVPAGLDPKDCRIPDGLTPMPQLAEACRAYEQAIRDAGGIDLQLLGIGLSGHIGFNEPGALAGSRTRLVELAESTRLRAAPAFGEEEVPKRGISVGIGTILEARQIVLLAFGEEKAEIVARARQDEPSVAIPATLLRSHPDLRWVLDEAAARRL